MKMIEKKYRLIKSENGSVMLFSIFLMTLFFVIVSSLAVLTIGEIRQSTQIEESSSAYMAAETGYERASNYTNNYMPDTTTITIQKKDQPLRTGSKPPTYDFEVVKAGAGQTYDGGRPCEIGTEERYYCFYSLGRSGTTVRKLDGVTYVIPENKSKLVTVTSMGQLIGFPSALEKVKLLDLKPTSPGNSAITLITQVSGDGVDLSSINPESTYSWGLLDKTISSDGRMYSGIAILLKKDNSGRLMAYLSRAQLNNNTTTGLMMVYPSYTGSGSAFLESRNPNKNLGWKELKRSSGVTNIKGIKFTLTYRPAAASYLDHTATLQANDTTDGQCLGVITAYVDSNPSIFNLGNIYNLFIARGYAPGAFYSVDPTISADSQYINIKNISELGTPTPQINLSSDILLNTK